MQTTALSLRRTDNGTHDGKQYLTTESTANNPESINGSDTNHLNQTPYRDVPMRTIDIHTTTDKSTEIDIQIPMNKNIMKFNPPDKQDMMNTLQCPDPPGCHSDSNGDNCRSGNVGNGCLSRSVSNRTLHLLPGSQDLCVCTGKRWKWNKSFMVASWQRVVHTPNQESLTLDRSQKGT